MLLPGDVIYVLSPDARAERKFHAAQVRFTESDALLAEFADPGRVEVGLQVGVHYYDDDACFVRVPARVRKVLPGAETTVIEFAVEGAPESADVRHEFRARVEGMGLTAEVGETRDCPILDISGLGFGLVAPQKLEVGKTVRVALTHRGERYVGGARVRSAVKGPGGKFRYGFEPLATESELKTGVRRITNFVQRERLRHPVTRAESASA